MNQPLSWIWVAQVMVLIAAGTAGLLAIMWVTLRGRPTWHHVVTHEVNQILPYVDRVLYLVDGRFTVGTVEQVMTTETLSRLYQADIEVVKVKGRYVVVGARDSHP